MIRPFAFAAAALIAVLPLPASAQTLEILYYEQPRFLGEDFQTNWITEYAPDLLQVQPQRSSGS